MASTLQDSKPANNGSEPPKPEDMSMESAIEHAKRAFALKKYEQAVEYYATALEHITKTHGEDAPETADLYFSYGKALLENAISMSSVLGKDQGQEEDDEEDKAATREGLILSFSGDGPEENTEEGTVDLFADAFKAGEGAEEGDAAGDDEGEEEGDGDEPEDDFNAAWEVLDLARAIYDKQKDVDGDEEVKLKLADTYIALGDVSLETEKFDQAITDYSAGLALKETLLPLSSRHIAEVHYKLCMVLDLTSGRLSDAIAHAEKAHASVLTRLEELRAGLANAPTSLPAQVAVVPEDVKGKGKATEGKLIRDDLVQDMTKSQIESEIKELDELKDDLALKVEELKTTPAESSTLSAPALAAKVLDQELGGAPSSITPTVVNDLTSMVVKKKKKPADAEASNGAVGGKRKAEGDVGEGLGREVEKKVKLDSPAES